MQINHSLYRQLNISNSDKILVIYMKIQMDFPLKHSRRMFRFSDYF